MIISRKLGARLLSFVLCLVCVLCLVQPAKAADTEEQETTLTTVVRNGASYGAFPIGQLENGTTVTVLDTYRDFYRVDCYDMTGYVACSQISQKATGEYYVNCDDESQETRTFSYESHIEALMLRHSMFSLAQEQLGKPYIYGSTGLRGFDCSGFTTFLYQSFGFSLHRRASEQLQDGLVVSREGLQVGDMIFFHESWDSCAASHVGIYVGNNQIIHASSSRGIVYDDLDSNYFAQNYLCARRVIHTNTQAEQPAAMPMSRSAVMNRRAS